MGNCGFRKLEGKLRDVVKTVFPQAEVGQWCGDSNPNCGLVCTRKKGHTGVHVSLNRYVWGEPSPEDFERVDEWS